ncbi:hypothetical protein [Algoriphagus namhaensis]
MDTTKRILLAIIATFIISCERAEKVAETEEPELEMEIEEEVSDQLGFKADQAELQKALIEIKNSEQELNAHDLDEFKPEIKMIESQLDSMKTLSMEYINANTADKAQIESEWRRLKEEVKSQLEEIEERFDELKVLDT